MVTHSETTIREQLRALIRLQHIDNCIDNLEKERGDLPDEIRDLEDAVAGLNTRIRNTQEEQRELIVKRKRREIDIKDAEMLIKRYGEQQLQVRNNREYDALTKEIETQNERIAEAKQFIQETNGLREEQSLKIEEAEVLLSQQDEEIEHKRAQLEEVSTATEQKLEELKALRILALEKVDERYRRAYNRLRKRLRDGRAVVKIERGAAAGFAVPPQRQVEIRQRNRIIACEHTGRIIVDADMYAESTADLDRSDSRSLVDKITELVEGAQTTRDWSISK